MANLVYCIEWLRTRVELLYHQFIDIEGLIVTPEEESDTTLKSYVSKQFSSKGVRVERKNDHTPLSPPKDDVPPDVTFQIVGTEPQRRRKHWLLFWQKPTTMYRVYGTVQLYGIDTGNTPMRLVLELFGTDQQNKFQDIAERLIDELGFDIKIVPANSLRYIDPDEQ